MEKETFKVGFSSALDEYKVTHTETFTFSQDEQDTLRRFCSDVRRLVKYRLFSQPASLNVKCDQTAGAKFAASPIDDEAWSAVMHLLRPLTLQEAKARHNFFNVRNMLARQAKTAQYQAHLRTMKDGFLGKFLPMQFSRGTRQPGKDIEWDDSGRIKGADTMEIIYAKWLHAFEQHDDTDKQSYFAKMFEMTPPDAVRILILQYVIDKVRAMLHLVDAVEGILATAKASESPPGSGATA